ncbi:non-specific lipid transfer protein GPI-anchored 19-like isoform X1 [Hibiscus syriacus]|uniref:non-specific lipid transfer protein GPI-anchored 19-like isoform X1 n=1 Tax=Hibiscus syriacus TaxID=106335 RepID=UPI00192261F4|nr:non-specific lipid transfer protein GPI-anchored 19-like isoform X1 [Hibiscus syriacus]
MAEKYLVLFLVVGMLCAGATAKSGCTNVLIGLSPCLNYITGASSTPSQQCCAQLAIVVRSSPQCLCQVLNGGGSSLGITINQTRALALPDSCNIRTQPISSCNAASPPPADSPVGSPESGSITPTGIVIVIISLISSFVTELNIKNGCRGWIGKCTVRTGGRFIGRKHRQIVAVVVRLPSVDYFI